MAPPKPKPVPISLSVKALNNTSSKLPMSVTFDSSPWDGELKLACSMD